MLPEDIQDLVFAVGLLALLAVVGIFFGFGAQTYTSDVDFRDGLNLFLLNYLKTETDSGGIGDLVVLSEVDEDKLVELRKVSGELLRFYDLDERDYVLRVVYSDGDVRNIVVSPYLEFAGEEFIEEGAGKQTMKIPSLEGGLITMEFEVENE